MSYRSRNSYVARTSAALALLAVTFVAWQNVPIKQAQADGGQPSLTVVSPNGGESYVAGFTVRITWAQTNVDTVTIGLKSCPSCLDWIGFNNVPVNINSPSGAVDWTIPSWVTPGNTYKIWIIGYHTGIGSQADESNGNFTVTPQTALTAALSVTTPLPHTYVQGQTNAEFTRINFSATGSDVALSKVTVQAAPSVNASSVANVSVYAGNTLIGTVGQLSEKTGSVVVTLFAPLTIPQYATVTLTLKADITYDAFDHLALGITGAVASANGQSAPVLNLPVYGAPMYFSEK